ncbi:MAG: dicarboxylate/amino acid:cation symporter [bacterium]|nr:dicarboxylate/amino acid:cation symporter [bacterium]
MRKIKLHWWILIGILIGTAVGWVLNATYYPDIARQARENVFEGQAFGTAEEAARMKDIQKEEKRIFRSTRWGGAIEGVSQIFRSLLKLIVIPLVVSSLITGIVGLGDFKKLGRMGGKALGWYLTTSMLAIVVGLLLVNVIQPGTNTGLKLPISGDAPELPESVWQVINDMIPSNVFASLADFKLIQVLFFAILFGIFTLAVEETVRKPVAGFFAAVFEIMMKMTMFVISLAPVGIGALVASLVALTGPELFRGLIGYAGTVFFALLFHITITLPALFWLVTRRNPYAVMRAMSTALLTGFSTASSSGTLPVTLERVEHNVGVSNRVSSFVLPIGATVNMDGTALYECVAVIFVAQLYASANPEFVLTVGTQLMIVFLALMVSIGAAGIPHAGLVMMVIIFKAIGVPIELAGVLWAVDRPLDMSRTVANIWSDTMGTVAIAHTENEIDESVLFAARKKGA